MLLPGCQALPLALHIQNTIATHQTRVIVLKINESINRFEATAECGIYIYITCITMGFWKVSYLPKQIVNNINTSLNC